MVTPNDTLLELFPAISRKSIQREGSEETEYWVYLKMGSWPLGKNQKENNNNKRESKERK